MNSQSSCHQPQVFEHLEINLISNQQSVKEGINFYFRCVFNVIKTRRFSLGEPSSLRKVLIDFPAILITTVLESAFFSLSFTLSLVHFQDSLFLRSIDCVTLLFSPSTQSPEEREGRHRREACLLTLSCTQYCFLHVPTKQFVSLALSCLPAYPSPATSIPLYLKFNLIKAFHLIPFFSFVSFFLLVIFLNFSFISGRLKRRSRNFSL